MKNSKRGFTLIELLAVIVIIAIILLITIPVVTNVIEASRKKAFEDDVLIAHKDIDDYVLENDFKGNELEANELNTKFISGKFIKISEKTEAYYITDGRYCAKGTMANLRINRKCYKLDDTPAEIDMSKLHVIKIEDRITVQIDEGFAIDLESGIKEYRIKLIEDNVIIDEQKSNEIGTYLFEDIDDNEHEIIIEVENGNNISTEVQVSLSEKPTYVVNPTGWAQSKTVTINYQDPENKYIHQYSIDGGRSWVEYNNPVVFNDNGTIIAKNIEGNNYIEGSSQTISQIDNTPPTEANVTFKSATTKSITVTASGFDGDSQISRYQFSSDDGETWSDPQTSNEFTFDDLFSGDYNIKARVYNGTYSEDVPNTINYLDSDTNEMSTGTLCTPKYSLSPEEGFAKSKEVTIFLPSGCSGTLQYSLNGAESFTNYTSPILFTENGSVTARVTDGKNIKDASSQTISEIDNTKPICGNLSGEGSSSSWAKTRTISIACSDPGGSGCKQNTYTMGTVNSGTVTTKQFSVVIEDSVGNQQTCTKTANVYVDNDAPTAPTTMSYVYGDWSAYGGGWTKNDVYAARTSSATGPTGSSDPGGSGVCKYQISSNNSTWYDYNYDYTNAMYHFSSNGTYTRYFRAVDCVGNPSASINRSAYIDKSAPNVPTSTVRYDSSSGTVRGNSSAWTNRTLWWGSFSASDNGSAGINRYEYSSNCSGTVSGTLGSSYTYDTTRDWQFCIRAVDNAGNPSSWSDRYYFRIDKTAPTSPAISGGTGSDWIGHNQIIWVTSDSTASSGINRYQYCINTSNTTSGCTWTNLSPVTDENILDYEYAFDPAYYHQANGDLITAFSGNVESLYSHFISSGMGEGRASSQIFNYTKYRNSNADLVNAFGNDKASYFNHFINNGMNEGRTSSDYFNYSNYKSTYSDLRNAFGNDARQYYGHAYYNGIREARNLGGSSYLRKAQEITTHGLRYIFFRAVSNVGNVGTASSAQVTRIGVYSQDSVCGSSSSSTTCTSSTCCGSTTKTKTCTKAGQAVSTCSSTYKGTCVSGTTSGGNCTCQYKCTYQAANTCTSSCCGSVSSTATCWHE